MRKIQGSAAFLPTFFLLLLVPAIGFAQNDRSDAVLWQPVNIRHQDLFYGPGGREMMPDLSHITFIEEKKGGWSKKYEIKDGSGNKWVAKVGVEAQPETAAVRLLAALGFKTEINYIVPQLTIPGVGTFQNVRLEARPGDVKRGKEWKWGHSPFEDTPQMKGLMLMMAFLNNWDMKSANNVILKEGDTRQYVISDLGATFGKTGNNSLPIFFRIGRSRNKPTDYARSKFVTGTSDHHVKVEFHGKNRSRMHDSTYADARWLSHLLLQLSDRQIRDAFRAANYTQPQIDLLTRSVHSRIAQLSRAANSRRVVGRR